MRPAVLHSTSVLIPVSYTHLEYYTKTRVITKDGYLYNYAASTLINVSYLANDGMLDSKYATSDVSLLLMYGRDVASYGGSNIHIVSSDKNEFTVFALMKHPTEKDVYKRQL